MLQAKAVTAGHSQRYLLVWPDCRKDYLNCLRTVGLDFGHGLGRGAFLRFVVFAGRYCLGYVRKWCSVLRGPMSALWLQELWLSSYYMRGLRWLG